MEKSEEVFQRKLTRISKKRTQQILEDCDYFVYKHDYYIRADHPNLNNIVFAIFKQIPMKLSGTIIKIEGDTKKIYEFRGRGNLKKLTLYALHPRKVFHLKEISKDRRDFIDNFCKNNSEKPVEINKK